MTPHDTANQLLAEIADLKRWINDIEAKAQAETEAIYQRYQRQVKPMLDRYNAKDKELKRFLKIHNAEIFDGTDKIRLDNGILLHLEEFKISIPRDALDKIEQQGWTEAIRVAKSLDRSVVETWPEERLVLIGATRRLKESFNYELATRNPQPVTRKP